MRRGTKFWLALALGVSTAVSACENLGTVGPDPTLAGEDLEVLLSSATEDGPVDSDASGDTNTVDRRPETDRRRHDARALFNRLAEAIPSFGGLYRLEKCVVALVLTDMSEAERAIAIVKEAIEPHVVRACPDGIRVQAVPGKYTYVQLLRVRHALRPLAAIRGVLGAHIDFRANKVIVGVAAPQVIEKVRSALARTDIPPDAVGVVVVDRRR